MTTLLLLAACDGEPVPPAAPVAAAEVVVPLDAPRLLRRMSIDLRGVVPTVEELDAVEADPAALTSYRDAFLADERLEDRLVSFFAEQWHTRLDDFELDYSDYDLLPEQEFEFERSVGEEPLRLMARVAVTDRPWTDVVTADYTVANEMLAGIWPLEYPEGESGWQQSRYTDGRPPGGVLTTNGLWWRYVTNISNQNRSRAAAISRLLLCQDLLSRPVSLSGAVALSDEEGTANAIRTVPGCVACHSTVEPLASVMFGFWTVISYNPYELGTYHAERERLGETYLGVAPGYFGQPLGGLVDLGPAVANDSRFYSCAAETAATALWRRRVELEDFDRVDALRVTLLDSDLRYRALLSAVLDTPEYQAGALTADATDADRERENTWRLLTPDMFASAVGDLTGFSWMYEGFDQLANDNPGYRVLAGGVDGFSVTRPQRDPGITWSLVVQRTAEGAASFVVASELVEGGTRRLFEQVTLEDAPGDAAFDAELARLHWRLYGVRADAARLQAAADLWSEVNADEGPVEAWMRLVSAMLRDPEFVGH